MTTRIRLVDTLAWIAAALVAVAAGAGLAVPGLYRDRPVIVQATLADNAFQLAVAVPLLVAGLVLVRRGSIAARLAVLGTLLYLAYFFGLYAIAGVVNAMTLTHIAVTGLAAWAVVLGLPAIDAAGAHAAVGPRLARRATIAFLVLVAGFHIPLWASQILATASSGELPAALVSFGWLNTPVYTFDLAFALPLGLVAAVLLARRDARGTVLAVPFVWFSLLLALDMFWEQAWLVATGGSADLSQAMPFGLIAALSAAVLAPVVVRRPAAAHADAAVESPLGTTRPA